ncbi:uncharacterized protein BDZ99DRAFT_114351 [Mytilinidion resinicola]|uniref:Uncharacterized protein n=1 Tax=Mytilinidion resinicola TaxID=574789 RepID=A0A6A6Y941_9PEZI|nr:uncharacterized protein BDZ99DRAFT_114351 [Mytilinidion resinicola]KAF2805159.1 hypothetical protein BDZ99DRAFT_114351 [Mytilinidion resinicola]
MTGQGMFLQFAVHVLHASQEIRLRGCASFAFFCLVTSNQSENMASADLSHITQRKGVRLITWGDKFLTFYATMA